MGEIRTQKIPKERYSTYLSKARDFYDAMKNAEEEENWNAAALSAIHCIISSNDALTTFFLELRSVGQKHEDALQLLKQTKLPGVEEKAKQFLDVLSLKNLVEYEASEPSENQAMQMIKQAERFYGWVKQNLPART